jgi:uncharacterized protein (TIGR02118 family)
MVKVITLMKRKQGLSAEEFSRYWEQEHGPLVVRMLPAVKKYIQNHAVRLSEGGEPQVDGVAEMWFENLQSWRVAAKFYQSEEGKVIRDDEDKFIERNHMVFLIAQEQEIKN